jgi:hypothetical protein
MQPRMGYMRKAYKIFVGMPEGKRQFGRPRCRWEDNIVADFSEIVCEGVDWIRVAKNTDRWRALVHTVMNFLFP